MRSSIHRSLGSLSSWFLPLSLGLLFLASIAIGWFDLIYQPSYAIGDWLINYSQGFIRRGLPGEAFLLLAHLFHLPVPWVALVIPALLYAALLYGVYRLANPLRRNLLWFALIFSPSTLPFILLNRVEVGYRKETLILASLVMVILLLQRLISGVAASVMLSAVFAVLILSHEASVTSFPFFFAAVAIQRRDLKRAITICVVPFFLAAALLVVVNRHHGDVTMAEGICSSIGGQWVDPKPDEAFPGMTAQYSLCSGSIAWLGVPIGVYHRQAMERNRKGFFLVLVALADLPFCLALFVLYRRDKLPYEALVILAAGLVGFVGMLALFYETLDWGRWLYTQNTCLLLVILMAAQRARSFDASQARSTDSHWDWKKGLAVALAAAYCVCWAVPVWVGAPFYDGYFYAFREMGPAIRERLDTNANLKLGRYGEPLTHTP
jgi:hypothetical protein